MAVMLEISKEILLIGEMLVELELIHYWAIKSWFDEPLIFHSFLVLLPFEIDEGVCAVVGFDPGCAISHYSSYQGLVIAFS